MMRLRLASAVMAVAAANMGSFAGSSVSANVLTAEPLHPEVYLGPDNRQQWNRNPAMYTPSHSQKIKGKLKRRHR